MPSAKSYLIEIFLLGRWEMSKRTAFIGHRNIYVDDIKDRLYSEVKKQIIENDCKIFIMGTHGDFDKLALRVCKELRKTYTDIKIEVVITSLKQIAPVKEFDIFCGDEKIYPYHDAKTIMYNIEKEHFKRKITESNKQMIDESDTLICYVNSTRTYGGAKTAYKYARKKGLAIVNLFDYKE